jgi:hypothetical protein
MLNTLKISDLSFSDSALFAYSQAMLNFYVSTRHFLQHRCDIRIGALVGVLAS